MQRRDDISYNHFQLFYQTLCATLAPMHISPDQTFFQELIMVLMGKDSVIPDTAQRMRSSANGRAIQLALPIELEELEDAVRDFNREYSDSPISPHSVIRVANMDYIMVYLPALTTRGALPKLIQDATAKKPEFIERHQKNFGSVLATFTPITKKHRIDVALSDVFEDTLCKVVQYRARYQFINNRQAFKFLFTITTDDIAILILSFLGAPHQDIASEIVSPLNEFRPHPQQPYTTQLCLVMSIALAENIVHFFNSLIAGSSTIVADKERHERLQTDMTIVNINNPALTHPYFVRSFTNMLAANSQDTLDAYRLQSNKNNKTLATSLEELVALNDSLSDYAHTFAEFKLAEKIQQEYPDEKPAKKPRISATRSDNPLDTIAVSLTKLITYIARPEYKFEIDKSSALRPAEDRQEHSPATPNKELFVVIDECKASARNIEKHSYNRSVIYGANLVRKQMNDMKDSLFTILKDLEINAGKPQRIETQPVMEFAIRLR